jgi:hypothetical protein
MWIPKTEAEIVQVVTTGSLEESSIFDAKKDLPSKNPEIAKDVAAMANDGGVLIYGIDEDTHSRPTVLNPIQLANQPERITAIVQTSIAEPPSISITTIPTTTDPANGYIVVFVPPSDRAPHMVVVKGENRYYGRTATGNYPLTEAEVARLYERRRRLEVDRDAMLTEEIDRSPFPARPGFAYLHLVAQPVFRDEGLLNRSVRTGETPQRVLHDLVELVVHPDVFPQRYSPDFYTPSQWIHRTEGFLGKLVYPGKSDDTRAPAHTLNLQIDFDGTGHLFCGRAAEHEGHGFLFFPSIVSGNTTRFLALLGKLYSRAKYLGMVDIGLAVMGLQGSTPDTKSMWPPVEFIPYDRNEYRRTARVSALLLNDDPLEIAQNLLNPLFNTIAQGGANFFPKRNTSP